MGVEEVTRGSISQVSSWCFESCFFFLSMSLFLSLSPFLPFYFFFICHVIFFLLFLLCSGASRVEPRGHMDGGLDGTKHVRPLVLFHAGGPGGQRCTACCPPWKPLADL